MPVRLTKTNFGKMITLREYELKKFKKKYKSLLKGKINPKKAFKLWQLKKLNKTYEKNIPDRRS